MTKFKYFDKTALLIAAKIAEARDYNRQLNIKAIEALDDGTMFPVSFSMLHEHAAGVRVDPHVRCMIVMGKLGDTAMLDVDMGVFNGLPDYEVDMEALKEAAKANA